jgi:hypothetical protein
MLKPLSSEARKAPAKADEQQRAVALFAGRVAEVLHGLRQFGVEQRRRALFARAVRAADAALERADARIADRVARRPRSRGRARSL